MGTGRKLLGKASGDREEMSGDREETLVQALQIPLVGK